jgi:hypothetical protein
LAFPAENSKGGLALKALQIASARASDDEGFDFIETISNSNWV